MNTYSLRNLNLFEWIRSWLINHVFETSEMWYICTWKQTFLAMIMIQQIKVLPVFCFTCLKPFAALCNIDESSLHIISPSLLLCLVIVPVEKRDRRLERGPEQHGRRAQHQGGEEGARAGGWRQQLRRGRGPPGAPGRHQHARSWHHAYQEGGKWYQRGDHLIFH